MQTYKSPEALTNEITCTEISGSQDKAAVFIATGSQIKGVTKRGKDFFRLETSHTEQIRYLHVLGTNLWSAGDYTLNCYASSNNKIADKYYYVSDDKINSMLVHHGDLSQSGNTMDPYVLLACNDSTLRIICSNGKLFYQTNLEASPTCLTMLDTSQSQSTDLDEPASDNVPTVVLYGL